MSLSFPLALDFAAESVAYRSKSYIKTPEGYGSVLSARPLTQEAIIRAMVHHEGGGGCLAMIKPKGLLGMP